MKKLTRIACLVAVLVLSGFTTAGAWPWVVGGYCNYQCGNEMVQIWTESPDSCCGTRIQCSEPLGGQGYALWWEDGYTQQIIACFIS